MFDWQLPSLRFKHITEVQEKTNIDLSDLEDCADLLSIRRLGSVIDILSPVPDFDDHFTGDSIEDAYEQLMDKVQGFFPSQQAQLLQKIREEVKTELGRMISG
jgi:hypothetical protein